MKEKDISDQNELSSSILYSMLVQNVTESNFTTSLNYRCWQMFDKFPSEDVDVPFIALIS